MFFIIDNVVNTIITKLNSIKNIGFIRNWIIVVLICYSSLNIYIESIMVGSGFEKGLNYWYINMDEEAENWGLKCEGELMIIRMIE